MRIDVEMESDKAAMKPSHKNDRGHSHQASGSKFKKRKFEEGTSKNTGDGDFKDKGKSTNKNPCHQNDICYNCQLSRYQQRIVRTSTSPEKTNKGSSLRKLKM